MKIIFKENLFGSSGQNMFKENIRDTDRSLESIGKSLRLSLQDSKLKQWKLEWKGEEFYRAWKERFVDFHKLLCR